MEITLTPQEQSDIKDVITVYGNPLDMNIPTNLLGSALRALKLNPLEKEISQFKTEFDPSGSGVLSEEQLKTIYFRKKKDPDTYEELIQAFRLLDKEGEGLISTQEFRYYMVRMGEQMPEDEVDDLVKQADNASGKVDIEKFAKYLLGIKD
mmetsp:Transcript_10092/g.15091  ORF Transcript_10092/g.15091 Transcript_10092/m.15091 type:complete len:151 (+) Transcript_10092:40-492(+)